MGIITREGTAPIQDGETGSAADVENEFAKLFTLVNGNVDTANLSTTAGILGTQLASATIPASKVATSTLTTAQMAASAVTKVGISSASNTGTMTASTSLVDLPGISAVTLTPGSTSDIIIVEILVSFHTTNAYYTFGVNISGGVGDILMGTVIHQDAGDTTYTFRHMLTAAAAASTTYTGRYKLRSTQGLWDSTSGIVANTSLRVICLPIKV